MSHDQGELNYAFPNLRKRPNLAYFRPFKNLICGLNSAFLYFINIVLYIYTLYMVNYLNNIYCIACHYNNVSINKYIGINIPSKP